jgi:hypothetical protein
VVLGIDVVVLGIDLVVVVGIVSGVVTTGMEVAGEAELWLEDVQPAATMLMMEMTNAIPTSNLGCRRL